LIEECVITEYQPWNHPPVALEHRGNRDALDRDFLNYLRFIAATRFKTGREEQEERASMPSRVTTAVSLRSAKLMDALPCSIAACSSE